MWKDVYIVKCREAFGCNFYGKNAFYPVCQSNSGARLLGGRTMHATLGLSAVSSLRTPQLKLDGNGCRRLERAVGSVACVAIDELSQAMCVLFVVCLIQSNMMFCDA